MKQLFPKSAAVLCTALVTLVAHAGTPDDGTKTNMAQMKADPMETAQAQPAPLGVNEGEVKRVDKAGKSITLKHGPLKSKTVEMGPMTMSFPVQDASLISNVKVGEKVKFSVETVNNRATVTALQVER